MRADLRHRWVDWPGSPEKGHAPCNLCGKGKRNLIHSLGGRCSMCFVYRKHFELDSSRRCDDCRS